MCTGRLRCVRRWRGWRRLSLAPPESSSCRRSPLAVTAVCVGRLSARFCPWTSEPIVILACTLLVAAVVVHGSGDSREGLGLAFGAWLPDATFLAVLPASLRPRPTNTEATAVALGVRPQRHTVRGAEEGGGGGGGGGGGEPAAGCQA